MYPELWFFLKGAFVGAGVAAPIGPVAILCIRQTFAYGWLVGLAAGLGTAIADGSFGAVAAFGARFMNQFMEDHSYWFYFIGGGFLCYIGTTILRSALVPKHDAEKKERPYGKAFFSTLVLTFASPMTIILFVGIFTSLGILKHPLMGENIMPLGLGVSAGAFLWWVFLTGVIARLRKRLEDWVFVWINKISGTAILGFGVYTLLKALLDI